MNGTPRLLLDQTRLKRNATQRNAARLHARCVALNVGLRPHLKTVKCAEVAHVAHEGGQGR